MSVFYFDYTVCVCLSRETPSFFWLVWQRFRGAPLCMRSPQAGDGADGETAVAHHLGRLTPTPVPGGVWSTVLPGLKRFRCRPRLAEGLLHVIMLLSHPVGALSAPALKIVWPGQNRACTCASVLGQGDQVRVLPPLPISAGTGGGVRPTNPPRLGFVPVVLIRECIRSWGLWHVDRT